MASQYAWVTATAPLQVQLKRGTDPVPAQRKDSTVPALAVGDVVRVEFIDRYLHVEAKVVDA